MRQPVEATGPELAEIAEWRYEPPYDYDGDRDPVLNPERYFTAHDEAGEVVGVAAFNERARIVYERAGFRVSGRHVRTFERWGNVEFVDMEER